MIVPLFINEISQPLAKNRSIALGFIEMFTVIGLVLVYAVGQIIPHFDPPLKYDSDQEF